MIGRATTEPCTCGGVFVEYGGCQSGACESVKVCPNCGLTDDEVAAEAERKGPVAALIIALRPTGTDKH